MNAPEPSFRHKAIELLRRGPFKRYIIGSAISDTGTWMQVMAQGWVLSTLTDRALVLGMVNMAAGLPTLALTMVGGSAADRFDKRMILIVTQVVQIVLAVILGTLVLFGYIQIWHILVLAALLGVVIAFEMPALSALVPELVRKDQIASAVALDRSVFHGSRLLGPSLAGLLVGWWGAASAFFANAFTFVALIISMILIPRRTLGTAEEEEQRRSGLLEGFRYVKKDRTILSLIALIALTTVFIYPVVSVMLPLYVRQLLGLGPERMGILMAVSGSGSLVGSLGLLSVARGKRIHFIMGAVVVVACSMFVMSRTSSFWLAAMSMGAMAIGLATNFGLANTIVQERAPAHLRGRISAVFGLSFFGLMPIAGLVVTSLSDLIGMRSAMAAAASVYATGALFVLSRCDHTLPVAAEVPPEPQPAPAPATVA
ncbi:MAG: MFS transporter [Chthoniobacterales bacterium]|nr:MFS transporter [Chthoniobacterales bacterium]